MLRGGLFSLFLYALLLLSPCYLRQASGRNVANEVLLTRAPNDGQTCGDFVPKVALMYLSKSKLPLAAAMQQWLSQAANLVPLHSVKNALANHNSDDNMKRIKRDCLHSADKSQLERQNLYSIYIHTPPSATGIPPDSPWHNSLISNRIVTAYGEASIMEATRMLIREALEEPANNKFVILSESDAPLYSALMTYQQIMNEDKSRVAACRPTDGSFIAPGKYFGLDYGPSKISHGQWRYSLHRTSLKREHAIHIANDFRVHAHIKRHCGFRKNKCSTDEHHVPVLLSMLGLETETDCIGRLAAEIYNTGTSHPKTFRPDDTTVDMIREVRTFYGCGTPDMPSYKELMGQFVNLEDKDLTKQEVRESFNISDPAMHWPRLDYACPLTVRKVHATSAKKLQELYSNCSSGLPHLASDRSCNY